jgi:putative oxidoreductase
MEVFAMNKQSMYAPLIIRIVVGVLFIIPGLQKLADPSGIIGMLGSLGFPAPTLLGWVLLLSEIGFGLAVLTGWKLQKTIWPLVLVAALAMVAVHIPAWFAGQPMALISVLFHALAIGALLSLYFSGPGTYAVKG